MSNLFQIWSGKETARSKSAQLMVFACPTADSGLSEEKFFSQACKQPSVGISTVGQTRRHEAAPGKIEEFGSWFQHTCDIRDGVILKVVGNRMVSSYGQRQDGRAALYLEAREEAALRKIVFQTTHDDIMQFTQMTIQGRFDLLTPEMLETTTLPPLTPYQRADLSEVRVNRVFTITVEDPERSPRPIIHTRQVENADGAMVRIKVRKRQRRIEL